MGVCTLTGLGIGISGLTTGEGGGNDGALGTEAPGGFSRGV